MWIGKGTEKNRMDHREDGHVRSNAQSERENRDQRETGTAAQHASRIAQILPSGFHPADDIHRASIFFVKSGVAEAALRVVASFLRRHASRHVVGRAHFDVRAQLLVKVALEPMNLQQALQPGKQGHCLCSFCPVKLAQRAATNSSHYSNATKQACGRATAYADCML